MGLALGITLGSIGLLRGAFTPTDTRGGPQKVPLPMSATLPAGASTVPLPNGDYDLPIGSSTEQKTVKTQTVRVPQGETATVVGSRITFPAESEVRTEPVGRWDLGIVVGLAVVGICLWGTLVGTMLPLIFKKFGGDPAVASGPLVATGVDITGIAIFFLCAKWILL